MTKTILLLPLLLLSTAARAAPEACTLPSVGYGTARVHLIGRFDLRDPAGPRFAWPGSRVEATFAGTGLSATLSDSVGSNAFDVQVDGVPSTLAPAAGEGTYVLAAELSPGQHVVSLVKRTEAVDGVVQLLALSPAGGSLLETPGPLARRLEFIGDSTTAGFGILGGSCSDPLSTQEDWTQTAGSLLGQQLGAEVTATAYSGIGVTRDHEGVTTNQMPALWPLSVPQDPTSAWPFAEVAPEVVVVELGANDFALGDPGPGFVPAYEAFVEAVRARYPVAWIVAALTPMIEQPDRGLLQEYLAEVVSAERGGGDERVLFFAYASQPLPAACLGHPTVAENAAMAAEIAPLVAKITGWCAP
jgi:lysophospholipase L1-like esterase